MAWPGIEDRLEAPGMLTWVWILVLLRVNRIRFDIPENVNKSVLHRWCLDDITTLPLFQDSQAVHGADDITTLPF